MTTGVPAEGPEFTGTVRFFDASKGFGFVTRDDGGDLYVGTQPVLASGRTRLMAGQTISFTTEECEKGERIETIVRVGQVPTAETRLGTIKFFNHHKGFGFVAGDDGIDYFLPGYVVADAGFSVIDGGRIEFTTRPGRAGKTDGVAEIVRVTSGPPVPRSHSESGDQPSPEWERQMEG
jgi:CspA family cold shock protein